MGILLFSFIFNGQVIGVVGVPTLLFLMASLVGQSCRGLW